MNNRVVLATAAVFGALLVVLYFWR